MFSPALLLFRLLIHVLHILIYNIKLPSEHTCKYSDNVMIIQATTYTNVLCIDVVPMIDYYATFTEIPGSEEHTFSET